MLRVGIFGHLRNVDCQQQTKRTLCVHVVSITRIQLFKLSETCQVVAFATNVTIQFDPSVSMFSVSLCVKCSLTAKGQIQEEHRPFSQSVLLMN